MHFFLVRAAQIFHSIAISIVTCVVKLMVVIVSQVHFSNPKTSTSLLCYSYSNEFQILVNINSWLFWKFVEKYQQHVTIFPLLTKLMKLLFAIFWTFQKDYFENGSNILPSNFSMLVERQNSSQYQLSNKKISLALKRKNITLDLLQTLGELYKS